MSDTQKVTISTHNGSAVAREHNIRNPKVVSKESHIDTNRPHEIWIDTPVRKAYQELFGKAVKAYNERQVENKRPERQIKNYYDDVCKSAKKHPVYELIIGIYGKIEAKDENGEVMYKKNENGELVKDDDGNLVPVYEPICSAEKGKEIMHEFVNGWEKRNPNLKIIGAYYHADEEGEPHVHIDYVPVAHGYTRGLETQTGLVKALGEQGFEKKGKITAQIQWEQKENAVLTRLCEEAGLSVDHPKRGKKHENTPEFKEKKQRLAELDAGIAEKTSQFYDITAELTEAEIKKSEVEELKQQKEALENDIDELKQKKKTLEGEVLTAEQVNDSEFKLCPLTGGVKLVNKSGKVSSTSETMSRIQSIKKTANRVKSIEKENKELKAKSKADDEKIKELSTAKYSREQLNKQSKDVKNNASEAEIRRYLSTIQFPDGTTGVENFSRWRKEQNQSKNKSEQEL